VNRSLLLAIVVSGAALAGSALAEEAAPAAKDSAPAANVTTPGATSPVHSSPQGSVSPKENASRPTGPMGANAAESGAGSTGGRSVDKPGRGSPKSPAKDTGIGENPIDMRITVQPHTIKVPPLMSEKKSGIAVAPPPHNPAHAVVPRDPGSSPRNAIGARLDEHARPQAAIPPSTQGGYPYNPGNPGIGAVGAARAQGAVSPARGPAVITGTGMTRIGSGPGTLGGPARNVTGINGSNIRVKP